MSSQGLEEKDYPVEQSPQQPQQETQNPAEGYAFDDVIDNFEALLADAEFSQEIRALHLGWFDFVRKRLLLDELRTVYVALWFLALQRSFPTAASFIVSRFLARHTNKMPSLRATQFKERATQYKDMLVSNGDQDFTSVARHLISFTKAHESTLKADVLRLALQLRSCYTFIFQRLF